MSPGKFRGHFYVVTFTTLNSKGRIINWYQISSCTCSAEVQKDPALLGDSGVRTLFVIDLDEEVDNAVISDCSVYPGEDEVLLEPGTRVEVSTLLLNF